MTKALTLNHIEAWPLFYSYGLTKIKKIGTTFAKLISLQKKRLQSFLYLVIFRYRILSIIVRTFLH